MVSHMLKSAAYKGMPSYFIVHRRELVKQSTAAFAGEGVGHGICAAGFVEDRRQIVQVAGIQTLAKRYKRYRRPKLIVWDECFPAGTMVDGFPIQEIRKGDYVRSFNERLGIIEQKKVTHIFKRKAPRKIYYVAALSNGYEFTSVWCTENHPFMTCNRGWIPCKDIKQGEEIYVMPRLRSNYEQRGEEALSQMLPSCHVEKKYADRPETYAGKKSYVDARNSGSCQRKASSNRPQAKNAGRERQRGYGASKNVVRGSWAANRGDRSDRNEIFSPNPLQDRHCGRKNKVSYRDRRKFSCVPSQKISGQKEGVFLEKSRVESITIHESRDFNEFGDGFVYNLEVQGNNNYFANGFLVHNCHHIAAGSWSKIYEAFPEAFHIGLTATPERLDGTGLKHWFQELINGPSVQWLIQQGFLAPYKIYAPSSVNTEGMHTRAGDFVTSELQGAVDKPSITGNAIEHYKRLAPGKRAVVFCVSIEHSKHVVDQFKASGVQAEHVDGETDPYERDETIRRFKNGQTMVLSNVELFGEGFDLPALEVAILLRPTQSLGLYLQQVGRSLRPMPGKVGAVILDHAGNCARFGLPCDEREWTLEGRARRKSGESDSISVRICPKCFAAQPSGCATCAYCGHQFELKPRSVEQKDGDLSELDIEKLRRVRRREQGGAQSMEDLIELGKQRGYKRPYMWAKYVFNSRQARMLQGAA